MHFLELEKGIVFSCTDEEEQAELMESIVEIHFATSNLSFSLPSLQLSLWVSLQASLKLMHQH